MKGLDTLIKLHKRTLDEIRKQIVKVENEKAQLIALSKRLSEELAQEIKTAAKQPEMGMFFGGFSKRIKNRQESIAAETAKLDQQLATLADAARAAYGEVKKFEIAKASKERREAKARDRKETARLDEIAGQQASRRRKQGD